MKYLLVLFLSGILYGQKISQPVMEYSFGIYNPQSIIWNKETFSYDILCNPGDLEEDDYSYILNAPLNIPKNKKVISAKTMKFKELVNPKIILDSSSDKFVMNAPSCFIKKDNIGIILDRNSLLFFNTKKLNSGVKKLTLKKQYGTFDKVFVYKEDLFLLNTKKFLLIKLSNWKTNNYGISKMNIELKHIKDAFIVEEDNYMYFLGGDNVIHKYDLLTNLVSRQELFPSTKKLKGGVSSFVQGKKKSEVYILYPTYKRVFYLNLDEVKQASSVFKYDKEIDKIFFDEATGSIIAKEEDFLYWYPLFSKSKSQ